jgi:hypothetical protein
MYRDYGVEVTTQFNIDSGHCIPTQDYGVTCDKTASPYLNKCDYAGIPDMLTNLLGTLKPGVE